MDKEQLRYMPLTGHGIVCVPQDGDPVMPLSSVNS